MTLEKRIFSGFSGLPAFFAGGSRLLGERAELCVTTMTPPRSGYLNEQPVSADHTTNLFISGAIPTVIAGRRNRCSEA